MSPHLMKDYEGCEMAIVLIITNVHSLLIVDCEKLTCTVLKTTKNFMHVTL